MFEGALSPLHWVVVLLIALLIFGPRKLPELGQGLGSAIRNFREGLRGIEGADQKPAAPGNGSAAKPAPADTAPPKR
jgi:sec-independent protein translocase protein TatA